MRTPQPRAPTPDTRSPILCVACAGQVKSWRARMSVPLCKRCDCIFNRRRFSVPDDAPRARVVRCRPDRKAGAKEPSRPPYPTNTLPGTPARAGVMMAREGLGLALWHPLDRRADEDIMAEGRDLDEVVRIEGERDVEDYFAARWPTTWQERRDGP